MAKRDKPGMKSVAEVTAEREKKQREKYRAEQAARNAAAKLAGAAGRVYGAANKVAGVKTVTDPITEAQRTTAAKMRQQAGNMAMHAKWADRAKQTGSTGLYNEAAANYNRALDQLQQTQAAHKQSMASALPAGNQALLTAPRYIPGALETSIPLNQRAASYAQGEANLALGAGDSAGYADAMRRYNAAMDNIRDTVLHEGTRMDARVADARQRAAAAEEAETAQTGRVMSSGKYDMRPYYMGGGQSTGETGVKVDPTLHEQTEWANARLYAQQERQRQTASDVDAYRWGQEEQRIRTDPDLARKAELGRQRWTQERIRIREDSKWEQMASDWAAAVQGNMGGSTDVARRNGADQGMVDTMTPEHQQIYWALYSESPERAKQYAAYVGKLDTDAWFADIAEAAGRDPASRMGAFIGGTVLNLSSGQDPWGEAGQAASRLGEALIGGGGQGLQERGIFNTGLLAGTAPENWAIIGGKGLSDWYQLESSIAQSAMTAAMAAELGGGTFGELYTLALMGGSAAASDYRDMLNKGADERTALLHSAAYGINEGLFEKLSLENLINADMVKPVLVTLLQSSGVEGSEEMFTSIADAIADAATAKLSGGTYQSDIDRETYRLMLGGMSAAEAREQASRDMAFDIIYDGLGGAISGGLSVGGKLGLMAANKAIQNRVTTNAGNRLTGMALAGSRDTMAAVQQYAEDNGIRFEGKADTATDTRAAEDVAGEAMEAADTAETAEGETAKPTRQERRAQRQQERADRRLGESYQRVQRHVQQQLERAGSKAETMEIYNGLAEQYGEDFARAVLAPSLEAAQAKTYAKAKSLDELQQLHQANVQGETDPAFVSAAEDAYEAWARELTPSREEYTRARRSAAYANRQGQEIDLTVRTEDGSAQSTEVLRIDDAGRAVLADGSTHEIRNLDMDLDTRDLLTTLTSRVQGEDANTILATVQDALRSGRIDNAYRALSAAITVYGQGQLGTVSQAKAVAQSGLNAELATKLYQQGAQSHAEGVQQAQARRDTQLAEARERGAEAVNPAQTAPGTRRQAKRVGATGRRGSVDTSRIAGMLLSRTQQRQVGLATRIAQALGVDVEFFASEAGEDGLYSGEQGSYRDGRIRLDINAGLTKATELMQTSILNTMSHELTHYIQDYSPTLYDELRQAVLDKLTGEYGEDWVQERIQEKFDRATDRISQEEAIDEVVADGCELMLRDSEAIRELYQSNRTLFDKIADWISRFLRRIREEFTGAQTREGQAMEKYLSELQGLWDKALVDAAQVQGQVQAERDTKNTAREGGEERVSLRPDAELESENITSGRRTENRDVRVSPGTRGSDRQGDINGGEENRRSGQRNLLDEKETYQQRDYSRLSDEALIRQATAESTDDPETQKMLAETQRHLDRIAELEQQLAEAQGELQTTDHKLNTRGIATLGKAILSDLGAGDVRKRGVAKAMQQMLTDAYQTALDEIDAGTDIGEAWENLYNNGIVAVADYLLENATASQKLGYTWQTTDLGQYMAGEEGRQAAIDIVSARVAADFAENRLRDAVHITAADRLVDETERRITDKMQGKLDTAKEENAELRARNERLTRENEWYRVQAENIGEAQTYLRERVQELQQELKDNRRLDTKARKALEGRLETAKRRLAAKTAEAKTWRDTARRLEKRAQTAEDRMAAANDAVKEQSAALRAARSEKAKIARDLQKQIQREQDIVSGKLKPPRMQKLLRELREQATQKANAHKDEVFANYKARRKATELRGRIANLRQDLVQRVLRPTDGRYVPAELGGALVDMLDTLDMRPGDGTQAAAKYDRVTDALHAMRDAYAGLESNDDPTWRTEYDTEMAKELKDLQERIGDRDVRSLNVSELQAVYDAVRRIRDTLRSATKLLAHNSTATIYDRAESIVAQMRQATPDNAITPAQRRERTNRLQKLSAMRAVLYMSGSNRDSTLYKMFRDIEDGYTDSMAWVMDYNKRFTGLRTGANERTWRRATTEQQSYGLKDANGKDVKMTRMQVMQLIMTWEREMHNETLTHLQTGGASIRDAVAIANGKTPTSQRVRLDQATIDRLAGTLTKWERDYIAQIRDYFQNTEAPAMGRVVYALKHRALQTEDYYVPYTVDGGYLESKIGEDNALDGIWVRNPGSTQQLKTQAPQPVIIDGIDTVMKKHVNDSGNYVSLALPIRDFAKVYNARFANSDGVTTMTHTAVEEAYGSEGDKLIKSIIAEVQGQRNGNSVTTWMDQAVGKLQSSFVRAALLINPSVTIKQAASYLAAGSVISRKALELGNRPALAKTDQGHSIGLIEHLFVSPNGKVAQRLYEEMDRYTSIGWERRVGLNMEDNMSKNALMRKVQENISGWEESKAGRYGRKALAVVNALNWIQRMDVATTTALWVACKEQARLDGLAVGSEKYWAHTTELYERVVRETQPMYDPLHRSAQQKNSKGIIPYLFQFRTVPTQNHGQLVDAMEEWRAARGTSREQEAGKFFAKTVAANFESAVMFSALSFLAAAWKHKTGRYRDKDDEMSVGSVLTGIGLDTASVWASNLMPLMGSEIYNMIEAAVTSLISGKLTTGNYDALSVGVVDMVNDLISAGEKLWKYSVEGIHGNPASWDEWRDALWRFGKNTAKACGIPAQTMETYIKGFVANVQDIANGRFPALNNVSVERTLSTNARRYYDAWADGDSAKMDAVLDEIRHGYLSNGKDAGKADELTRNGISSYAIEQYKAGNMDLEELRELLEGTGLYDADKLNTKIKGLLREELDAGARDEDGTIRSLVELAGMEEDAAWDTVRKWADTAAHGEDEDYSWGKYDEVHAAIDANRDIDQIVSELVNHGYDEKNVRNDAKRYITEQYEAGAYSEEKMRNYLSRYCGIVKREQVDEIVNNSKCYIDTGYHYKDLREAYEDSSMAAPAVEQALQRYGGLSSAEAKSRVRYWRFQADYEESDLTEDQVSKYYDTAPDGVGRTMQQVGIKETTWIDYCQRLRDCKGTDADGDGKTDSGSKKAAIMQMINALPLTAAQKDALYYLNGWSKKTISDAPWR